MCGALPAGLCLAAANCGFGVFTETDVAHLSFTCGSWKPVRGYLVVIPSRPSHGNPSCATVLGFLQDSGCYRPAGAALGRH